MNPILRKELRLIGPAWMIAMAAPVGRFFLPEGVRDEDFGFIAALAAVPLAVAAFGQEVSLGTFGLLLAQPERRPRIWNLKTMLTLLAMIAVVFVFVESSRHNLWPSPIRYYLDARRHRHAFAAPPMEEPVRPEVFLWGAFAAAFFSSGLWTTLLFRHVMVACSLTFLVPFGVATLITGIFRNEPSVSQLPYQEGALVIYAAAGFLLARWQFMRAEDAQPFGGTISASATRPVRLSECLPFSFRARGPILATLQKEIQLQHPTILVAAGVALIHVAAIILRKTTPDLTPKYPELAEVWVLWLFVPLVSGCMAVAEERRLNTLEGSLSLPMAGPVRFAIKLAVVLGLGVVVGAGGLLLVEKLGMRLRIPHLPGGYTLWADRYRACAAVAITAGVSFYVSTLCRNSLQALGAALVFMYGGALVMTAWFSALAAIFRFYQNNETLFAFQATQWPILTVVLAVLAYRNFSRLRPDARNWMRDTWILLLVLAVPPLAEIVILTCRSENLWRLFYHP